MPSLKVIVGITILVIVALALFDPTLLNQIFSVIWNALNGTTGATTTINATT